MDTPPETASLLRLEVGRLRARESRRVFDAALHIGTLAGERDSWQLLAQDLPALDAGLRVDVVCRLLANGDAPGRTAWLVRSGLPELSDRDLAWFAASTAAFGIHAVRLEGFYVITRTGWLDVRSGAGRVWKRLRL